MSETEKAPAEKPVKKKKKTLLFVLIGVLALGAGAGGGIYASGLLGGGHHAEAKEKDQPKLKIKEGADEALAESWEASHKGKAPDPELFQASYYPLKDNITANLADSDGFLQVGVGVSTYYDERVLKAVETHEMAVRSAVLLTLSNQATDSVTTPEGKEELKQELKRAINQVLEKREGFGGIDDVFFTSFVVQ